MIGKRLCVCPLCEAMCGLEVEVQGHRVVDVRGDNADPLSAGFFCPKARALQDLTADSSRLSQPMLRGADGFSPISWPKAIQLAASELGRIQREHGRDAVGFYTGNPNLHSYAAQLVELPFKQMLGSRNTYSTASVDHLPHMYAALEMFGHPLLLTVPDIDRTDLMLIIGANPAESNGSLMGAPGMPMRLRSLRARGGRVIVVDPRRTRTAELADRHLFIKPGTDALFLLALASTLFAEDLVCTAHLTELLVGLPNLAVACAPFTPERVAPLVGIDSATIIDLAREFSRASSAVCYGRLGVCTQTYGSICAWLINSLNVLTGNLDRIGGAMFPRPAIDLVGASTLLGAAGGRGRWGSRVRGLPEFGGDLPLAALAEEIETPGRGQVRGLITSAGNPVLSAPNGARLERALAGLDFMVSIDCYLNETTRHAHLVLPAAMPLERDHYDVVFRAFGVRDTARYQGCVVTPPPGVREDWRIYCQLGRRLARTRGGLAGRFGSPALAAIETLSPRRILSALLRLGPHHLSLARLADSQHAVDLGPLQSALPRRLRTPRKQIHMATSTFLESLPSLVALLGAASATDDDTLTLIGRRQVRSKNSWLHHLPQMQRSNNVCTLMINSCDARHRGLSTGQTVEVRSRTGSVQVPLEITDKIMPGVVSLPHGFGHARMASPVATPARWHGASINDITDDARLDSLSGTAAFVGVPVQVLAAPSPGLNPSNETGTIHASLS